MLDDFLKKCADIRKKVLDSVCKIESKSIAYVGVGYILSNILALFLPLFTSAIFSFCTIWFIDKLLHLYKYGWNNAYELYNINLIAIGCLCGILVKM